MDSSPDNIVDSMRAEIDRVLPPLLPKGKFSLRGFPHFGAADCAAWLGMVKYLREDHDLFPSYIEDIDKYIWSRIKGKMPQGDILLHGGNGLGDAWPEQLQFKENVVLDNPGNRIVLLPQTLRFIRDENLARTVSIFNAHHNLTLLVSDENSLAFAQAHFSCAVHLCPDMAWALGPRKRRSAPVRPLLFLDSSGEEGRPLLHAHPVPPEGYAYENWRPEDGGGAVTVFLKENKGGVRERTLPRGGIHLYARLRRDAYLKVFLSNPLALFDNARRKEALFSNIAFNVVETSLRQLSEAKEVVTNDPAARILCALLGVPCHLSLAR